ncbi:hypothetical protein [Paenibacillus sp. UNC499MF]|uniref:hypothetical protein n=1 Tax=Paenibacillus sp. UNC499MF TaxID=1502751 RepID=UPI00089F8E2C|nr:hypothetical protein [Paenibacillus sp. UNC499MF]SEG45299.1 hypothetical protein SAMN02799616_03036 [Paenibacillus sp. UNC499MF]
MSIKHVIISKPNDDNGFSTLECGHCGEQFKLMLEDIEEDIVEIYCPYCGLVSPKEAFVPQDIVEHAKTIAENEMNNIMKDLVKDMEKMFKGNKNIKFTKGKSLTNKEPRILAENNEELQQYKMLCCDKSVKLDIVAVNSSLVYCPFCGVL